MAAIRIEAVAEEPGQRPPKSGPLQAAKTVLWAFFGVRKRAAHESAPLTPVQVIIAGLIGGALFVLTILSVVWLVLR